MFSKLKQKLHLFNILFGVALICAIISFILILLIHSLEGAPLILHFSRVGLDALGAKIYLWRLPILAFLFIIINTLLARAFYQRDIFVSKMLMFGASAVNLLIAVASFLVYVANT